MSDTEKPNAAESNNTIKLRGLPWNVCPQDIIDFLKDVEIRGGENGIHLITSPKDGRPNGEAFVECQEEKDFEKAFEHNKEVMGHRYIEIFGAKPEEFEFTMKRQNIVTSDTFVKLRGLPYTCTVNDIEKFFEGLELKNGRDSIIVMMDNRGRTSGEAFVQFSTADECEKALKKNREKIGHRYIEIFRSSGNEVRRMRMHNNMRMDDIPSLFDRGPRGGSGRNSRNIRDRPYDAPWGNNGGGFRGGRDFDDFIPGNGYGPSGPPGPTFNAGSGFGGGNNGGGFGGGFGGPRGGFDGPGFRGGNTSPRTSLNPNTDDDFLDDFGPRGGPMGFGGGPRDAFSDDIYCVHLRGMPYDCLEKEVYEFFQPVRPVGVDIIYNNRGRHSGEADAFFRSHDDAQKAMKKDKAKMGARYIELFFKGDNKRGRF